MKKYTDLLGFAKAKIDHGFSQAGKRLSPEDKAQRALMLLASRSVAVSNALMLLCLNNHANEALPLLRSLLQLSVEARWIAAEDTAARALDFYDRHGDLEWEELWGEARLRERMAQLGFQKSVAEGQALDCRPHLYANAQGLPWGHVFHENAGKGVTGEQVLCAAAAIMGHVIKALETHWPGSFEGAEHLWEQTETSTR